jgi:hypothetical protein
MGKLSASDRKSLIRLASELPGGSAEKKAILSSLRRGSDFGYGSPLPPEADLRLLNQAHQKINETQRLLERVDLRGKDAQKVRQAQDSLSDAASLIMDMTER